jgi:glucose-1-phosphate cytidylyltransferase
MKVVLFCGGLGMRLREHSESVPKPMVPIGYRPVLWHVMKYYAHFGHNDFVLCLGYKADVIKDYFLNYDEALSNDFVLSEGGREIKLINSDIQDWTITFVDTGTNANIGQRLMAVRDHLAGEDVFMANYSDGLTSLPLPSHIEAFEKSGKIASFISVKPTHSFHIVDMAPDAVVKDIKHIADADVWINGGYFVFRQEIFDHMREGEELVHEPFQRLIADGQLLAYPYDGFWASMDTLKDKQQLEEMYANGIAPWEVWKAGSTGGGS